MSKFFEAHCSETWGPTKLIFSFWGIQVLYFGLVNIKVPKFLSQLPKLGPQFGHLDPFYTAKCHFQPLISQLWQNIDVWNLKWAIFDPRPFHSCEKNHGGSVRSSSYCDLKKRGQRGQISHFWSDFRNFFGKNFLHLTWGNFWYVISFSDSANYWETATNLFRAQQRLPKLWRLITFHWVIPHRKFLPFWKFLGKASHMAWVSICVNFFLPQSC